MGHCNNLQSKDLNISVRIHEEKSVCVPNFLDKNNECKKGDRAIKIHEISSIVYQDREKKQGTTLGTVYFRPGYLLGSQDNEKQL